MTLILALTVLVFGRVSSASSACPEFVNWYNSTSACAMLFTDANCTGLPLQLYSDGERPNLRRLLRNIINFDDEPGLTALVRPLCRLTYYQHDADGRWSTTREADDAEPWLKPWSEVRWAECECSWSPRDLLGSAERGHCVPTENLTTVHECDNFNGSVAIECEYTVRFWPSYRSSPTDLESDAGRISAAEEGALLSHKFPDRPLDWPAQDKFAGSMTVPPYQLLRIKQRYLKCGYYVWPTSEVVTDFVHAPREVYSYQPELRSCQPTFLFETTLGCVRSPISDLCVYSATLQPYKLRDPDFPSDQGLPLSKWEEEDLERILLRELANFPKTPRKGEFTYTTHLPPGQSPRVVRRYFRCGAYVWPTLQVLIK